MRKARAPKATKKKESREFDLHVWIEPETSDMNTLVTISGNGSCHRVGVEGAIAWFRDLLEQEAEVVNS
jgi:hypothetical protein